MRIRFLHAAAILLSIGLGSSARTQTPDTIQALKDSLSPDQQNSIMQNVLGKSDGTGKTTNKKLETPDTVNPNGDESRDQTRRIKKQETFDGRILRQMDEDPELRPDDTVLIELTPIEQ